MKKPGKNLFVIRVANNSGKRGFVSDKPHQLIAGKYTLDLKGYWQYKVWSDEISNPLYIRYAWSDFSVNPNLFNKKGLPASPFRTDN